VVATTGVPTPEGSTDSTRAAGSCCRPAVGRCAAARAEPVPGCAAETTEVAQGVCGPARPHSDRPDEARG